MKNFYTYDNFYTTVIDVNIITFCIMSIGCKNITIYKKWLVNSDWPEKISKFENLNLKLFEI